MASHQLRRSRALSFEILETREAPSATPLLIETFDQTPRGALPTGWTQWASTSTPSFAASPTLALSGNHGLASDGTSSSAARTWVVATQPADVQVGAAIYLNSLIPLQVFARGKNLDTTTPTYYSLSVTRGLQLQLNRVVNGVTTTLGTLNSASWLTNQWVRVTLGVEGSRVRGQVLRLDTGQYLNASGQWQAAPTWALDRIDSSVTGGGQVGLARPVSYSGAVSADEFTVLAPGNGNPAILQPFNTGANGSLPLGWSQWSSNGSPTFGISSARPLSGATGLASTSTSTVSGRAWLNTSLSANLDVSAAVFLNSSLPAQVLARGSGLNTATPSYIGVSVTQGLRVQLVRVQNGVTTTLATLNSATAFSNQWVRVTLYANGSQLRAQVFRLDTKQFLNAQGQWQTGETWALSATDAAITTAGLVGLARPSAQAGTIYFDDFLAVDVLASSSTPTGPTIPRHYPHIRIAQLAYDGLPLGAFEDQLLRTSVDLVIPSTQYLNHIHTVAPTTPTPIYSNTSNIYLSLLTDWLSYADANRLPRESAFYHVTQPTYFTGDSASSRPVTWFWGVYRGGDLAGVTNFTTNAHMTASSMAFGAQGESIYVGYPDRFREINIYLRSGAANGWTAVIEYPTAVDADGNPTAWATLSTLSDGTARLTRSGRIVFDPPANWVASKFGGSARLMYVRFRTLTNGTAPVAATIVGRDYVGAAGRSSGTIPAFDYAADTNNDGYLNDAEYARHAPGKTARFEYESRIWFGRYGQMRPATNPSSPAFRAWAVDYHARFVANHPLADGIFMDNSTGTPPAAADGVRESVSTYAQDYGSLLKAIAQKISPRLVVVNIDGTTATDPIAKQTPAYFQEFAIRPLAHNFHQFEDLAAIIAHRAALSSPSPYAILDSHPRGGSPTDARTQLATLAYYYLVGDPHTTFLMFYGGYEPSTSWTRHWVPAAAYDVGRPLETWSLLTSGADPENRALSYRLYQRPYEKALVLYKPLSSDSGGSRTGTLSGATTTVHQLGGSYRPLRADGTLGSAVTSISLRNGEGAILIKA
jgi:hypothetical protein